MKKIRILFPYSVGPNVSSFYSLFFENIIPILRKTIDVKIIWVVYQPEKNIISKSIDGIDVRYIQDYSDALIVLKEEQPDIIFSFPWPDFMAYSFSLAAKSLDIPTFSILFSHSYQERSHKQTIAGYITRFFEKSIPTDSSQNQKQFMRRGVFFLKKYVFLMKTQKSLGFGFGRIIKDFFMLFKLLLVETSGTIDSRFATTIHFAVGENIIQPYVDKGFNSSSIILTGNPIYDSTFKKFSQKKINKKSDLINVLFAPSTLYESGYWTKEQRDFVLKETVNAIIQNKDKIRLTVKIHPTTSILSDYKSIIHSLDNSIPVMQNGDIRDFIDDADIYISSEISSGEFFSVIAKKPIIFCQFIQPTSNIILENNLAVLCDNPKDLVKLIHSQILKPPKEEDRQKFIQKYLYKDDGKASERISDELIKLIKL
jgi:hypothetical protein